MLRHRSGGHGQRPVIGTFKVRWPLAYRVQRLNQYGLDHSIAIIKEAEMSKQQVSAKRGWTVVLAGTGINLALGILYTWSIYMLALRKRLIERKKNRNNR